MSVALASRSNLELIAQKGKLVKIRFDMRGDIGWGML